MGSLATHFSTFMFFFPIGLHRLHSSFTLLLKHPSHFRSKPWFPTYKNFDLFALLITLPISALTDFLLFLSFSVPPTYRFSFLQHGFIILIFWVLLILILFKESHDLFCVNDSFLFVLGGVTFLLEYFINGKGFVGVNSHVYDLYGNLSLICGFSCLYLSVKPSCFVAEFMFSSAMMFKGTWVLQIGMNLYTSMFGLKGCNRVSMLTNQVGGVDVKCDLAEDGLRGIALMKLLFVWHAIVVIIVCLGLFWLVSYKEGLRGGEGSGPLLAKTEAQGLQMQQLPEVELE